MERMVVDVAAMRQALTQVTRAAEEASAIVARVEGLNGSLPGVWQGGAATSYQSTIYEWCQQGRRILNALTQLRDALAQGISTLETAEHDAEALSRR